MQKCEIIHTNFRESVLKLEQRNYREISLQELAIIKIKIKWIVLSDGFTITDDQIKANHDMLNACFSGNNIDIDATPTADTDSYHPYSKTRIGAANILFLPENSDDLVIERKSTRAFSSGSDLQKYMEQEYNYDFNPNSEFRPDAFTMIVCHFSGGLLGVAAGGIGWPLASANYTTIGSISKPGSNASYGNGKTAVHEVGHALGLNHIFNDWGACDGKTIDCGDSYGNIGPCYIYIDDIPWQKKPNYTATLVNGVVTGDNRELFRDGGTNNSCLTQNDDDTYSGNRSTENEMICNFMDYGYDRVLTMFTPKQCHRMRSVILGRPACENIIGKTYNKVDNVSFDIYTIIGIIICMILVLTAIAIIYKYKLYKKQTKKVNITTRTTN